MGCVSKPPRTWLFLSRLPAPPCRRCTTVRPLICTFYPPTPKIRGRCVTRANSEYTQVTCEHLVSPNSFVSCRPAWHSVTQRVLAGKRTCSVKMVAGGGGHGWTRLATTLLFITPPLRLCVLPQWQQGIRARTNTRSCGTESTAVQYSKPRQRRYQMATCLCWGYRIYYICNSVVMSSNQGFQTNCQGCNYTWVTWCTREQSSQFGAAVSNYWLSKMRTRRYLFVLSVKSFSHKKLHTGTHPRFFFPNHWALVSVFMVVFTYIIHVQASARIKRLCY